MFLFDWLERRRIEERAVRQAVRKRIKYPSDLVSAEKSLVDGLNFLNERHPGSERAQRLFRKYIKRELKFVRWMLREYRLTEQAKNYLLRY